MTTLPRAQGESEAGGAPPVIDTPTELERLTTSAVPLHVRYAEGPGHDARETSRSYRDASSHADRTASPSW